MPKGIPKNGINKGQFKKENKPWNKGGKTSEKTLKKMRGKIVSDITRKKQSEANIRRGSVPPSRLGKSSWNKNMVLSQEHKKKIGISRLGKKSSELTKKKQREWSLEHPNRKFKETGIELKIESELIKRGIFHNKQVPLCKVALVDFYLPDYKIVIQCDGCYYHNCPIHHPTHHIGSRERDVGQDSVLESNGFNVYRFWEHDINKSSEECINKINLTQ